MPLQVTMSFSVLQTNGNWQGQNTPPSATSPGNDHSGDSDWWPRPLWVNDLDGKIDNGKDWKNDITLTWLQFLYVFSVSYCPMILFIMFVWAECVCVWCFVLGSWVLFSTTLYVTVVCGQGGLGNCITIVLLGYIINAVITNILGFSFKAQI